VNLRKFVILFEDHFVMVDVFDVSFDIWSVLLLFGFLQGVFLAGILIWGFEGRRLKFYLITLILLISFNLFNYLLLSSGLYGRMPHFVHLATPSLMLLGPVYYFYVRLMIHREAVVRFSDGWHVLPFVFTILFFLPFYSLSASQKIELLQPLLALQKQPLTFATYIFITGQILHSFVYVSATVLLLRKAARANSNRSLSEKYRWLKRFSHGFLAFWAIDFIAVCWFILRGEIAMEAYYLTMLICALLINLLILFAIRHNRVFTQIFIRGAFGKYRNSAVQASGLQEHLKEIMVFMEKEKPYLDPDLSLLKLAGYVQKPRHLISQVLNVELGKNFYEFINDFRFKEVKKRLQDPRYRHLTILGIAYDSGFSNKNTFNRVFKKQAGKTPSQYLQEGSLKNP